MSECINLEGNNVHFYLKELSHMYYVINYSCYHLLYKVVKLHLYECKEDLIRKRENNETNLMCFLF